MSIQPLLQVEATLLRRQMPDLLLRPGMSLAARVAERSGRHGILMLAGTPLVAELPDEVSPGDKLQLVVQEARTDKVVLKLVPENPVAPPPDSLVSLPLPGGMEAQVRVDEREGKGGGDGGEHASIGLTYESPALGSVQLHLELVPGSVIVSAQLRAGPAHELAANAAGELRDRLEAITGRSAEVRVTPRYDPLDLYA